MKLRCQVSGMKCPRYTHEGVFQPDAETVKRLLPDLNRCADCMAYLPPRCPDFRDDLRQIATIVLIEKGPSFQPTHQSRASFGTFIRSEARVSQLVKQGQQKASEMGQRLGLAE